METRHQDLDWTDRAAGQIALILKWFATGWSVVLAVASANAASPDAGFKFLEARVKSDPADFLAWNQLSYRYLTRARETGNDLWISRAAQAADASLQAIEEKANPGGLAAQARADLASHRFSEALAKGKKLAELQPGESPPLPIMIDALLELGELDGAAQLLDQLSNEVGETVNVQSRAARLALARGRLEDARKAYRAAEDAARVMTPPSPLTVAWCELQLGEIAFRTGDWESAETRYQAALELQPGWWSAREHLAELRGAQGRTEEAFQIYAQVIADAPRPELLQAVGDLHLFLEQKDEARKWHDRALAAYRAATEGGSVAYFHHLTGFFCDSEPNPAEALQNARKDLELRHNAAAQDSLAWALYKNGELAAAGTAIGKALESGVKDSHILYHAGMIRMSAGDVAGGQAALREAAAVNPRFQSFHVHR